MLFPFLQAQDVYPYAHYGKWGVINDKGQIMMKPELDSIGFFTPQSAALHPPLATAYKNGKAGLITEKGKWVLKPSVESIGNDLYLRQALRWAKVGGKYGLVEVAGKKAKWLTKPIFDEVSYFEHRNNPLVKVRQGKGWGVLNTAGKLVVPCENEEVEIFPGSESGLHIRITNKDKVTRIAEDGTPLVEASEDDLEFIEEVWGMAPMEDGRDVVPEEFRSRWGDLGNGFTEVILESKEARSDWKVLKRIPVPANCEVEQVKLEYNKIFHITVSCGGKFGFIGDAGQFLVEPIYESISWITHAEKYIDPVAILKVGDRVGAASQFGTPILPAIFSKITTWYGWLVVHTPNGYQGLAKPTGELYLPVGWDKD